MPVWAAGDLAHETTEARLTHLKPLGRLDEAGLADAYARASVFVSLATYEPFGLSVLEAAQAGLPLVLSDIPTFRELWDGVARFVPPESPEAAANAIAEAIDDRASGLAAQSRAARYDADTMTDATLAIHHRCRKQSAA